MTFEEKEEYNYKFLAGLNKEGKRYRFLLRTGCLVTSFLIWEIAARLSNNTMAMVLALLCLAAGIWTLSSILCSLIQDFIVLPHLFNKLEKEKEPLE